MTAAGGATGLAVRVHRAASPDGWTAEVTGAAGQRILIGGPDAMSDARRLLESVTAAAPAVVVFAGMGLGWVVEAARTRWPGAHLVVFEPVPELAEAASQRRGALLDDGKLWLLQGPDYAGADQLWRLFDRAPACEPAVVADPMAAAMMPDEVAAIHARVARAVRAGRLNAHARREHGGRYLLNTLRNLPMIAQGADAAALNGRLSGVPAVLAAAGPSLDANMPALRELADRALVIAADTTWRPLVSGGIEPQIVVAVDPTAANGRHLEGVQARTPPWLLAEGSVAPRALRVAGATVAPLRIGDHHPWPWLTGTGLRCPTVRVWGSVLTAAVDLALGFGCDPIVFVGADLAYTDGRPYCRGTSFEADWASWTARGVSLRQVWSNTISARPLVSATDVSGRPTLTGPHLLEFRDWIVARTREHPDRTFINATGAGILHGGRLTQTSLADALAVLPAGAPDIRAILARALRPRDVRARVKEHIDLLLEADWDGSLPDVVPRWIEFAGGGVSAADIRSALAAARAGMERRGDRGDAPQPTRELTLRMRAPDRCAAIRALLTGERAILDGSTPAPHVDGGSPGAAMERLLDDETRLVTGAAVWDGQQIGACPASVACEWTEEAALTLANVEERLIATGSVREVAGGFWTADVEPVVPETVTPAAGVNAIDPDTLARLVAVDQWLSLDRTADAGLRERRIIDAALRAAANPAAHAHGDPDATLSIAGLAPTPRVLPFGIDMFARALTGTLVTAAPRVEAASDSARFRLSIAAARPRRRLADPRAPLLQERASHLEPFVLTDRGLPRSWWCATIDEHRAIVTPGGGSRSFVIAADGDLEPLPEWPLPLTGEAPWGEEGGSLAWSRPTRALLLRSRAAARCVVTRVPFSPFRGTVRADGVTFWCAQEGGLWEWSPGSDPRLLAQTEPCLGIRLVGRAIHLDPVARDGARIRRVRMRHRWIYAEGRLSRVETGAAGQCAGLAVASGWRARAYPFSDLLAVSGPAGARATLGCHAPAAVAWVGGSLLVSTLDGSVLLFPGLRAHVPVAPALRIVRGNDDPPGD